MKPINISPLVKRYGPGYVAKNQKTGRVVAYAKRLDILFKKTKNKTDVIISWIPKSGARYVFRISVLGFNKSKLHCNSTFGVGGFIVKTWDFKLPIKLGAIEMLISACAVETKNEVMPLLLGKKDIFESKFNLLLDSRRKITVISQNK